MDQMRFVEIQYRIEHRHKDGAWGVMEEVRQHHGAADHDPERKWGLKRIFRCTSCDEQITVIDDDRAPNSGG
jgi:hypothetical protein